MPSKPRKVTVKPLPVFPDIIIAQHLINTNPARFHWIIFVQYPGSEHGTKIHVTDAGTQGYFVYEKKDYSLIYSSSVASAAVIGNLGTHTIDDLDTLLHAIPCNTIPPDDVGKEPKFTCRVWVREAVRMMHKAGYLKCPDVDALEAEMMEYGTAAAKEIDDDTYQKAILYQARTARAV